MCKLTYRYAQINNRKLTFYLCSDFKGQTESRAGPLAEQKERFYSNIDPRNDIEEDDHPPKENSLFKSFLKKRMFERRVSFAHSTSSSTSFSSSSSSSKSTKIFFSTLVPRNPGKLTFNVNYIRAFWNDSFHWISFQREMITNTHKGS